WYLICLGRDDGIGNSLRQQAVNLGLDKHILWLGTRSDIADVLFSADIGVLCPFKNEGFSNAILEGMTAGLPMVVTDIGGNKEAVVNGETGYVVEPRNTDSLAAAILDLANNRSKAKQFGEAGQKRVKESFSLSACVDAYEKLYNSL
ncbi:MAG: glycosyltransferase, partial [Gammaproteobacteria bacterium]|nr:glycosyltransferase [Gammaproteobacteria bacterium]